MQLEVDRRASALGARPDLDSRTRIEGFVRSFYRDVAQDDLLGPVFAGAGLGRVRQPW